MHALRSAGTALATPRAPLSSDAPPGASSAAHPSCLCQSTLGYDLSGAIASGRVAGGLRCSEEHETTLRRRTASGFLLRRIAIEMTAVPEPHTQPNEEAEMERRGGVRVELSTVRIVCPATFSSMTKTGVIKNRPT